MHFFSHGYQANHPPIRFSCDFVELYYQFASLPPVLCLFDARLIFYLFGREGGGGRRGGEEGGEGGERVGGGVLPSRWWESGCKPGALVHEA